MKSGLDMFTIFFGAAAFMVGRLLFYGLVELL
jgi:hypothetical protein